MASARRSRRRNPQRKQRRKRVVAAAKHPPRPQKQMRPKPAPKIKKGGPGDRRDVRQRDEKNTTFVVYRTGNAPPSAPDVTSTDGALIANFRIGSEASEGDQDFRWTHLLEIADDVDVRDDWPTDPPANQDTVYVPDQNGTAFDVIFVELVNRGTPQQHKRVYLNRQAPTWPTDEL